MFALPNVVKWTLDSLDSSSVRPNVLYACEIRKKNCEKSYVESKATTRLLITFMRSFSSDVWGFLIKRNFVVTCWSWNEKVFIRSLRKLKFLDEIRELENYFIKSFSWRVLDTKNIEINFELSLITYFDMFYEALKRILSWGLKQELLISKKNSSWIFDYHKGLLKSLQHIWNI